MIVLFYAKNRINDYTSTAGIVYELLHTEIAVYKVTDQKSKKYGQFVAFRDHNVHAVLKRSNIKVKYSSNSEKSESMHSFIFKNYVNTTYSGGSYYGTMKNGKPHGIGSFNKGFKYSGQWCNGLWNGVGVLESDGEIYIGYFTDHLKTGYGVKLYSTCDTYEGFFKNNDRHGKGTMYFANGTVQEGYWVQDRYVGKNPPVYQR